MYDFYTLGEKSLIKYDIIDNQFYYYICITYQNKEIRDYRKRLVDQGFSAIAAHGFLDQLAKELDMTDSYNCKGL